MVAGRSTDSEGEVLSEEDYSAKVASEGSLAVSDKPGGEWELFMKLTLHDISDVMKCSLNLNSFYVN